METKEILEALFKILPIDLREDKFLIDFWNLMRENCSEHSFLIGKISINVDLYQKLDKSEISKDKFLVRDDDVLMSFLIFSNTSVLFKIRYNKGLYFIEAKIPDGEYMIFITAIKNQFMTRVETLKVKENNDFYDVFDSEIKYYDADYNIKSEEEVNIEREKDVIFAAHFGIPFVTARFFRENFHMFKEQLNANRISKIMELDNKGLAENDLFRFCSPFRLGDLEDYASSFAAREIELFLKSIGENIPTVLNNNKNHIDISFLKNSLLWQIGDEEIVMSYNMISNFAVLVDGKVGINGFSTRGYIVKKENGNFLIYNVVIDKGIISVVSDSISGDRGYDIFNKNSKNKMVEGLENFFGTRGLK